MKSLTLNLYRFVKLFKVDDKETTHQEVCVLQVLSPEGPDLPLSSDVPDIEFHAVRSDALYVEALK